jgi:truncated hemoglobin YjbI
VPFAIDRAARDRWLALMSSALDEAKLPGEVDAVLREFFAGVSEMLLNRAG